MDAPHKSVQTYKEMLVTEGQKGTSEIAMYDGRVSGVLDHWFLVWLYGRLY
jgi:hypothetical protein